MTLQINTTAGARDLTTEEQADARAGLAAASATDLSAHAASTSNPHSVTKDQVGLGSVDNTADAAKPVSTAQATAIGAAVTAHVDAADPHPGKYAATGHTHAPASIGAATTAQGANADTALQPGAQLTQGAVNAATAAGVALLGAASDAAQRTALGLGTAATTAATAYATAAQGVKADAALAANADAIADVLEAAVIGAPADLARIQSSVSGDPIKTGAGISQVFGAHKIHIYGDSLDASSYFWKSFAGGSGGKIREVGSSAVGGYRSDQVLAKLQTDGINTAATILPFGEGTNDAAQGITPAVSIGNIKTICDIAKTARVSPLVRLVPPSDVTAWNAAANKNFLVQYLWCDLNSIPFIAPFEKYRDIDGSWTVGTSLDQTHPTSLVYAESGRRAYAELGVQKPLLLPLSDTNPLGLITTNALLQAHTANKPTGWSELSLTGHTWGALTAYSYPFRGNRANLSVAQSAVGYVIRAVTGFTVGSTYRVVGVLGISGSSNLAMSAFIRCSGVGVDLFFDAMAGDTADHYVSRDFVIPVGTTAINIYFKLETATSGAYSGVFSFGALDIFDVTANTFV
jgi:hypothetical protein